MKILHAKTPEFSFDIEKLEVLEEGGEKKVMQIHNIRNFGNFMEEAEVKYDCIVLLQSFKSFITYPDAFGDGSGRDCCMIRFWGKYKQEYLNHFG